MSLSLQNLFTNSPSRFNLYFTATTTFKTPTLSLPITSRHLTTPPHLHNLHHKSLIPHTHSSGSFKTHHFRLRVYESQGTIHKNDTNSFNFDSFLSIAELLCLISSVAIGFWGWKKALFVELGNKVLVWGVVLLAGGISIGSWIRRRQWRRVCRETVKGGVEVNLLERIEKLEDDLRSSATIIRVLSRQLEKLGIRFRVTRKSLKEPIAETAALAQKNSEATRALAQQEDILEKELGEIQKVLLAMQEQQRKQLELILAIGKAGKLWESRRERNQEEDTTDTHNLAVEGFKQKETHQI